MKKFIFVLSLMTATAFSGLSAQMNQMQTTAPIKQSVKAAVVQEQLKEDDGPKKKTLSASSAVKSKKTSVQTKVRKSARPIKGQIVDFSALVMGGNGKINKKKALALIEKGKPIVFKSGNKIYFVLNADGSFAAKNLAKYANNNFVGIIGTAKKVNGLNIIIADKIESMD